MIFRASWIALLLSALAIGLFGVILVVLPSSDAASRAIGAASIGMGLFGSTIILMAFRRRERWAWWSSWYYPVFWVAHLVGGLPPGHDHVHQVVFIALTTLALVASCRAFFR